MSVLDGTPLQKALFGLLLAVALVGLVLAAADRFERIGTPNVGWMLDGQAVSPTNDDASEAGLRGGGRILRINGLDVSAASLRGATLGPNVVTDIGATNTITVRRASGEVRDVTIVVRPWQWHDFLFTQGATDVIALFLIFVGVAVFVLRPYEPPSWALLSLCSVVSGTLVTGFIPVDQAHGWNADYFFVVVGLVPYVPFHMLLAFPVVHPLLVRRPGVLWWVYGAGAVQTLANLAGADAGFEGVFAYARNVSAAVLLIGLGAFTFRCARLAVHRADPLVAQRARILLAGVVVGLMPFGLVQFTRETFGALEIDSRFLTWPIAVFVLALARVTLRPALMNARIAVRKAVLYTAAVAILSMVTFWLVSVRPFAVGGLLFPLLYFWPRFEARLNARLYPQRARFAELLREVGADLGAAATVPAVLEVAAFAPARLCDARSTVTFLLPGAVDEREHVRAVGVALRGDGHLETEAIVQLMRATRREVLRAQLAVEPQYVNVRTECETGFDRLGAALLVPLVHDQRVVGGLAVGARKSGDPYEQADIDALATAGQQAVQAVMRVAATERLVAREREFADLKRYFPPQIIDQVMARGGAAELGSQRKLVTVLFADLRGFTSFSDSVEPEEVIATLDEYHAAMGARIAEYEGTLERFAGDGFMVFFNDPVDQPDHVERAASMALAMREDVERLRAKWTRKGYGIHAGMGIHTGYATCGFIGYEGRRDYAVIGNVTNLAARLSDVAGPGEIVISARSYGELDGRFVAEPTGDLHLKGFQQPQPAFRLLAAVAAPAVV